MTVIKQESKEQQGAGLAPERGMVFSLLLQSPYDKNSLEMKNSNDSLVMDENNNKVEGMSKPEMTLSSSTPVFLAGYEDGSINCFDIRTLR